jgi:hypothetical protein
MVNQCELVALAPRADALFNAGTNRTVQRAWGGQYASVTHLGPTKVLTMDPLGGLIGDRIDRNAGIRHLHSGASGHHGAGADESEKYAHDSEPFSRLRRRRGIIDRIRVVRVCDPWGDLSTTQETQTQHGDDEWTDQRRQTFFSWPGISE